MPNTRQCVRHSKSLSDRMYLLISVRKSGASLCASLIRGKRHSKSLINFALLRIWADFHKFAALQPQDSFETLTLLGLALELKKLVPFFMRLKPQRCIVSDTL